MICADFLVIRADWPHKAADLATLCFRVYQPHFTYLWTDDGRWYQDHLFNEARLRTELAAPNVQYLFAILANQVVGYPKVKLDSNLNAEQAV